MTKQIHKLNAAKVKSLPTGKHADGAGLWLFKSNPNTGRWILRISLNGRRREMGLGSASRVSLAEARQAAREAQELTRRGLDPVIERARLRRRPEASLAEVTDRAFAARQAELKNDGLAGQWRGPLDVHVLPKIGKMPVTEIDQIVVRDLMQPLWHKIPSTAEKAIQRLAIILRHGAAEGHDVDLQAIEKARALLGKQRRTVVSIPSMPWREVPAFYQTLVGDNQVNTGTLALRFLILTASRSGETRGLSLQEIDGDTWSIPAARMKAGKAHRIPLSGQALAVVQDAQKYARGSDIVFSGTKAGKPISDMTMLKVLDRRGIKARPHGFRSSFRDWVAELDMARSEVAETALAHNRLSKVEAAYLRSDYLDERKILMGKWADFVTGGTA